MKRVLVTGASGLIGRHAVATLLRQGNWDIHVAARHLPALPTGGGVTAHSVDLLDPLAAPELVRRIAPSHLLHLAWTTDHGRFWRAPENLDWVAATLRLARAFGDVGGRRMVAGGTCAEYDWSAPELVDGPCHENTTPTRPHTLYGVAKDSCQRMLTAFGAETGIETAWGRVFFPFGPGEDSRRLIPSIIASLRAGKPAPCSPGTQVRDFIAGEDAGAAFAAITASGVTGPVNVGSGIPVTIAEVALTVGRAMGRPDLIHLGALPLRLDDPPRLVADIRRLTDETGFRCEATLEQRIGSMVSKAL
jgi:nucleoside-diphosphate-sugar epimerase